MRLKELRIEKGYTQKNIADKLSRTITCISDWERGRTEPDISDLKKLSQILNTSVDYLIENSNDFDKIIENKISSDNFTSEEIKMIKKIRLLGPYEQTYIKAQIDALSDTAKSKQKEKI
ncbi:MAG: helix-turn-helix transcriptional regulator [Christensenellaceae bacterium]